MTTRVWCYSETKSVAREVVTAGSELAKSLGGEAIFVATEREMAEEGCGRVLFVDGGSVGDEPNLIADALALAAKKAQPSAILVGATRTGRIVASKLAGRLRVGCLSDLQRLWSGDGSMIGERSAFAGKVVAQVKATLPCVATVKTGVYPPATEGRGSLEVEAVGNLSSEVKLVQTLEKQAPKTVDPRGASVVVSAGRGFKRKEDLRLAEDLAGELGAALGCSRPLSSDYGWLPEELHIGLTGITVRPSLYLALGISGQLQHIAGIRDSKVIAAVNTDRSAPIFQVADYGIVGDLYQVVPAILRLLRS